MGDIVYTFGTSVYLNITNQCPCKCTFCIRSFEEGIGSASSLWHRGGDPSLPEVLTAVTDFDFNGFKEAVFCGYGEPTCALNCLVAVSKHLKETHPQLKIRVNTNGLSDLIHGMPTARLLCQYIDTISISLNAPNAEKYLQVTQPSFGLQSFDAMLHFASDCRQYCRDVRFTVVDTLSPEEIADSQRLADQIGIPLRIRKFGS